MEAILKVTHTAYITLMARPTWRLSWKREALMMVTLTAYIKSSPWWLDLHGALLKDECTPDSHCDSLYRVLTLTAKSTQRLSWKTKALLTVTVTAYIVSSPWQLYLHWGSPERRKHSWRSLWQLISGSHPDS